MATLKKRKVKFLFHHLRCIAPLSFSPHPNTFYSPIYVYKENHPFFLFFFAVEQRIFFTRRHDFTSVHFPSELYSFKTLNFADRKETIMGGKGLSEEKTKA